MILIIKNQLILINFNNKTTLNIYNILSNKIIKNKSFIINEKSIYINY